MSVWRHFRQLYRTEVMTRTPWYTQWLRAHGKAFVSNYSPVGDALLTLWPCEGDADAGAAPVGDRHYEYAFTVAAITRYGLIGQSVLDVGSSGSFLPTILAAMGVRLTCIDVREWPIQWPGLRTVVDDLVSPVHTDIMAPESFDAITCISTLEHFGLGRYGDSLNVEGDKKGIGYIARFLKPGGLLILTVPYGRAEVAYPAHRIYDRGRFSQIIQNLDMVEQVFFGPVEKPWVYRPCTQEEAENIAPRFGYAVTCCVLIKT